MNNDVRQLILSYIKSIKICKQSKMTNISFAPNQPIITIDAGEGEYTSTSGMHEMIAKNVPIVESITTSLLWDLRDYHKMHSYQLFPINSGNNSISNYINSLAGFTIMLNINHIVWTGNRIGLYVNNKPKILYIDKNTITIVSVSKVGQTKTKNYILTDLNKKSI